MIERRSSYLRRALAAGALLAPLGVVPLAIIELVWVFASGSGFGSVGGAAAFAAATLFVPMAVSVLLSLLVSPLMLAISLSAQRLAQQRLAEPRWLGRLYAVACTPLLAVFIGQALSGRQAQQMPLRWLIALGLGVAGVAGAYWCVRLVVGARDRLRLRRWGKGHALLGAVLLFAAAGGIYAADQRVLVRLYGFFHFALLLAAVLCSQLSVAAIYAAWRPTSRRLGRLMRPRLVFVFGVLVLTAGAFSARRVAHDELLRFVVYERTALQRKLMVAAEAMGVLRFPPPKAAALGEEGGGQPGELMSGPRVADANLVLITVDALRSDHMGVYGSARRTTPNLDTWAGGATVFERGYCPVPTTSFSLTALLTGSRVHRSARRAQQTLPALLRRYGYKTGGFFPPSIFYIDGKRFDRFATTRFDFEYTKYEHLDAARRVTQVLDFLDRYGKQKFFIWVHFFEAHHPYESHEGFTFGDQAIDRYDSEVSYVDHHVGRLLRRLARDFPRTVVALTADHGEAFGEHGMHYHGSSLYEEQVRVPLAVSVPGAPARRVDGPAQSIDLPVTLLRLVDIPVPAQMDGRDLGPWIAGESAQKLPPAFVEHRNKRAIIDGSHKLIYDTERNFSELYALKRDPGETENLVARERKTSEQLRGRLLSWMHPPRQASEGGQRAQVRRLLDRAAQGDAGTVDGLVELYRQGDPVLRRDVVTRLVRLRASAARDLLVQAAQSKDPGLAIPATVGAALLGHVKSLEKVGALLARPDLPPALRRDALMARAVHAHDKKTTRALCALLRASDDIYERHELIDALAATGDPNASDALRGQLKTLRTRLRAIDALGRVRGRSAVPELIRALVEDRFITWRKHAARALGAIGDRRAIAPLRRVLARERESAVVGAALWALKRLGALSAAPGVRPLELRGGWRCAANRCVQPLGVPCRAHEQLLLLVAPPAAAVEVRCDDTLLGVLQKGASARLDDDRLSLPALAVSLRPDGATLQLVSRRPTKVEFAALRRGPTEQ